MSTVDGGPYDGLSLRELTERHGAALLGPGFKGSTFPLMIKLIDAADRLSVQVHPDDELARQLGLGHNGKTECWFMLADGGELYQGTKAGVDRAAFEAALQQGRVADTLNRFAVNRGDFFFLEARTVHALGSGCLLYEIQQTSDVTFRVYDWDRVGLDGKPRPLHIEQSLETIDFSRTHFGPRRAAFQADPERGGQWRLLADCAYFRLEEADSAEEALHGGTADACSIVICIEGRGTLATRNGEVSLDAMQTRLIPAAAGGFRITPAERLRVLVATPKP
jgi:mannose-6-phosphate isomerase